MPDQAQPPYRVVRLAQVAEQIRDLGKRAKRKNALDTFLSVTQSIL